MTKIIDFTELVQASNKKSSNKNKKLLQQWILGWGDLIYRATTSYFLKSLVFKETGKYGSLSGKKQWKETVPKVAQVLDLQDKYFKRTKGKYI